MPDVPGDDSHGFADVERTHLRSRYLPDFDWVVHPSPSPRLRPAVPLHEARVGLVDTSGAHRAGTPPVGASGRAALIPLGSDIELTHPGYDVARAMRDTEVVHPVRTLQSLAADGVIGWVAPQAVSVMGGVLIASRIIERGVPAVVAAMLDMQVDLALLVPA